MKRTLAVVFGLAILAAAVTAWADLRDYAPTNVSVTTSSGALLAADNKLHVLQLTNTGDYDVWVCHANQTAVVGKGFYLPSKGSLVFSDDSVPQQGLNAIASGGTTTVALGRG
jgi:hypothetical protein